MQAPDKSILIIEDNPDDALLTIRALKKLSYTNITHAENGSEALEFLYGNSGNDSNQTKMNPIPDLILLDLNLPVIDGFTMLKEIRSHQSTENTPLIILSSSSEDKDIEMSYKLGANSYIRKPVDFIEFEKAALLISEYWLTLNVPPA